ncbi:MAG: hypothetical protein CL917_18980 [Deltaproteobacteria bacterium]|nr:hypothetical protein [Deltaproteobacteria bacterium]
MKSAKRTPWHRLATCIAMAAACSFFAFPALGETEQTDWRVNPEDGSEAQVKEVLKGAEAMLAPPVKPSSSVSDAPFVAPEAKGEGYPKLDVPHPPWHYDTAYFFGLSRGLFHEDISGTARGFSLLGTVPFDLVGLPFALVAGCFGS